MLRIANLQQIQKLHKVLLSHIPGQGGTVWLSGLVHYVITRIFPGNGYKLALLRF
jgi:hypothetical protein